MLLLIGIFLFIILIVVHEYGHFLVAKRNGVDVEEFGIGFPPKVAGKTFGKGIFRSYYSFNLLPLGGFVRLKGENDADKRKGSFGAASYWSKTKITMAGVVMNFIVGAIIFTILALSGMPVLIENQVSVGSDTVEDAGPVKIGYIEEGSPADLAGFEQEDVIVAFNESNVTDSDSLYDLTEENAGKSISITYQRDDETQTQSLVLLEEESDEGYLGIVPYQIATRTSTWSAPLNGIAITAQLSWETLSGIAGTFSKVASGNVAEAGENVSGPVGIFVILRNIDSLEIMLTFIGLISITLAIMNALPIPALDGGRWAVMTIYKVLNKPLSAKTEQAIHGTGMVVLLILVAIISVVDVNRFF